MIYHKYLDVNETALLIWYTFYIFTHVNIDKLMVTEYLPLLNK